MDFDFTYILDKIRRASFIQHPFPHLDIQNVLSDEHLQIILSDPQLHFPEVKDHDSLHRELTRKKWKIQPFPGCVSSWKAYKESLNATTDFTSSNPVESTGITFRLVSYQQEFTQLLMEFFNSSLFHRTLTDKFNIQKNNTIISAIQKNLTGYEISPHPDVRKKCLTYLLNINNPAIDDMDCHTHFLQFKDPYKYIEQYWEEHPRVERCWVPWDWCTTTKMARRNNSMIMFRPNSSPASLHAIKLDYNHLPFQRTQIYGNLLYTHSPQRTSSKYHDLKKIIQERESAEDHPDASCDD